MMNYRGFLIKPSKKFMPNYEVSVPGVGGSIPDYLGSIYTSVGKAKEAIDIYLTPKPKRAYNVSKTKPKSGD